MSQIAVDLGNLLVPGIPFWNGGEVEVYRYNIYKSNDYVFGVLHHAGPNSTVFMGFYTHEGEAIKAALEALK